MAARRKCTVCTHPQIQVIDAALGRGTTTNRIAERFSLSQSAVARHRQNHLVEVESESAPHDAAGLLKEMRDLQRRVSKLLTKAEKSGATTTVLNASREIRLCLRQIGEIAQVIQDAPQTTINNNTQINVAHLRQVILEALEPFPDARQKVAAALIEATEAGAGP